ncbi:MAG TPA: adenylyltransferase/cytidyltransferase family protein, partial [Flavobacteriaceae bacterium]|nr:adenylyltransferase/cytidyltransferase family protein [Flavobacteriaceae bacterium]
MKIIDKFNTFSVNGRTVVTIGTFDGVHLGHQKIIERLKTIAKEKRLKSVILTFFPHPRMVLQSGVDIKLLNTIEERQDILSRLGVDYLVIKKFTKDFAKLSAEHYVKEFLVDGLNAKYIIVGYDHRFGKNRRADIKDLKAFGEQFDFEVEEISVKDVEEV